MLDAKNSSPYKSCDDPRLTEQTLQLNDK